MFERIMSIMKRGGTATVEQMARELNTTPEVVAGAIDQMARAGLLRQMSASCESSCNQCVFAPQCHHYGAGRLWRMRAQ